MQAVWGVVLAMTLSACGSCQGMRELGACGGAPTQECRDEYRHSQDVQGARRQGCDARNGAACVALARVGLRFGAPTGQDLRDAERGCDLGLAEGCYLAWALTSRPLAADGPAAIAADPDHARVRLAKGCTLGDPLSCSELAQGRGDEHAVEVLQRACDRWSSLPAAPPADPTERERVFTAALASVTACRRVGAIDESKHDRAHAALMYRTACQRGDQQGCVALGRLTSEVDGGME